MNSERIVIRGANSSEEPQRKPPSLGEAGSALVMVVMLVLVVSGLSLTMLASSALQVQDAQASGFEFSSRHVAEAGFQLEIFDVKNARDLATLISPFIAIDALDTDEDEGEGNFTQVKNAEPIIDSAGNVVGEVDVFVDVTGRAQPERREVVIVSIGYVPSKADYDASKLNAARTEVRGTVAANLGKSRVFDYAYFINHWGWFYADSLTANGSVRSNGQFDFGGYAPTVNGSPRYESSNGTDLIGYIDDNNDGVMDGSDGGVYSGFTVVNNANVQGMAANADNQHEWQDQVQMPNLNNLDIYESMAVNEGATVSIGGSVVANGVLGDDASEPQNLYLEGTAANPIVLNGPVVVRGDVIIKGVVTGQGSIYAGRNVYIAESVEYLNGPATPRPASNDEATVESWLAANQAADAMGLFAREHVVVGDYTHHYFGHYVGNWLNHPLNASSEDAGADGIQNTALGPDGIAGTADDDVLEGDGVWTVDYYTAIDDAAGLIPPGYSVGDPIPGSGEDIDGDGIQDHAIALSDFNLQDAISDASAWAGNRPATASNFSDVSSIYIDKLESSIYTNHAVAALMLNFGGTIEINGSIVSRNESLVYGADHLYMNHDPRLLGSDVARTYGVQMPIDWEPLEITTWTFVDSSMSTWISAAPNHGGGGGTQ